MAAEHNAAGPKNQRKHFMGHYIRDLSIDERKYLCFLAR